MPLTRIQSLGITDGTIVNADINASAAIASTKLSGVGITEADSYRVNTDTVFSGSGASDVSSNWERVDTDGFDKIGTGLSQSSGIFSFPSTGYYLINFSGDFFASAARVYVGFFLAVTLDNSNYTTASAGYASLYTNSAYCTNANSFIIKVTDITNIKFKFTVDKADTVTLTGSTAGSFSGFTCIKLAGV
jgi:hypothetical protein